MRNVAFYSKMTCFFVAIARAELRRSVPRSAPRSLSPAANETFVPFHQSVSVLEVKVLLMLSRFEKCKDVLRRKKFVFSPRMS